jgi:DNA-binding NtrC family response regulator
MLSFRKSSASHASTMDEPISGYFVDSDVGGLGPLAEPMGMPAPQQQPNTAKRILLVGPPGPATGELLTCLRQYGYQADYANSPDSAHWQLAQRSYEFVFLIEEGQGEHVPSLCRSIRKAYAAACPRLVVVARRRALLPQIDAWLGGCHKYLVAPLKREGLQAYLDQSSAA